MGVSTKLGVPLGVPVRRVYIGLPLLLQTTIFQERHSSVGFRFVQWLSLGIQAYKYYQHSALESVDVTICYLHLGHVDP